MRRNSMKSLAVGSPAANQNDGFSPQDALNHTEFTQFKVKDDTTAEKVIKDQNSYVIDGRMFEGLWRLNQSVQLQLTKCNPLRGKTNTQPTVKHGGGCIILLFLNLHLRGNPHEYRKNIQFTLT